MIFLLLVTLTQQADLDWQNRDRPDMTEQAIVMWAESVKENPNQPNLYIQLTKACGRAVRHASTSTDRRLWADRARAYGARAVEKNPGSAEAYAAYGEALGQWANAHKGVHSLKAVRQAVETLKHALTLNPKNAYAHMLLSSFYREAPGVISVGDKPKAFEHAKLAVEYGPGYAINHLVLARVLLDRGQKEEAIKQLQIIMALAPPADAIPETHADQETAAGLLQSMGVKTPTPQCGEAGGICTEQP